MNRIVTTKIKIDPNNFSRDEVDLAVRLLRLGEVVVLPTETVYGLAANATDSRAVEKIFEIKRRPASNPIIVHVSSTTMAKECAAIWDVRAELLARRFWPGPLTLVVPKSALIPDIVTAGGSTVGIRCPAQLFTRSVIESLDAPIAAPSANPFSYISPTTAEHVIKNLDGLVPLIVDAGACEVGIESTVLDLTGEMPTVLRPGLITPEQIGQVLGGAIRLKPASGGSKQGELLKSPGQFKKHYSPRARVVLCPTEKFREFDTILKDLNFRGKLIGIVTFSGIKDIVGASYIVNLSDQPEKFAKQIYSAFHDFDMAGVELIVVEEPPDSADWLAVRDRLFRAAAI